MKLAIANMIAMPREPDTTSAGCRNARREVLAAAAMTTALKTSTMRDLGDQQDAEHLAGQLDVPVAEHGR